MTEMEKRATIMHLLEHGDFAKEQEIPHHFCTNVLRHSISVARGSLKLAEKLHIKVNESDLLYGALLHDYFLYNYRKSNSHHGLHGYTHAKIAADNARKDYKINDRVYNIIYSHMFPLNLTHLPKCKEAWIVTFVDKVVALKEQSAVIRNFSLSGLKKSLYFTDDAKI